MDEFEGLIWVTEHTPLCRYGESADFALRAVPGTVWVLLTSETRAHRLSRAQGTRGDGPCTGGGAASVLEYQSGTFRDQNIDFTLKTA